MDLTEYGFNPRFQALAAEYPELSPARVVSQEKGLYRTISADGEHTAAVSGNLRYRASSALDLPAVGDFVMQSGQGEEAVINEILPRKSVFVRKASGTARTEQVVAANIDTLFLCMSLNNDYNLRRLERYLSVAWDSGAAPVIVLTKTDLCDCLPERISEVEDISVGADIITVSAFDANTAEKLKSYLCGGKTAAFLGSSGVGKSTLINLLLGGSILKTNGLRNDDKGRHTTTHRELIRLACGGMVIDTPGMRELGMWDSSEGVDKAFSEISKLASHCRWRDCTHSGEPGCAVQAALENGLLDAARLNSYKKLTAENNRAEKPAEYLAQKRRKFIEISKTNKKSKRDKRK